MKRITTSRQRLIFPILRVSLFIGFVSIAAYSQNSQGTILGHVQDSSGAAVAGANITATNVNTNVIHQFATNSSGDYVFVNMIPGAYQVKVERDGFKTEVSGNLILEVDQTLRLDFTLQVGTMKETIMVVADAQMVQADNTTTGNVLDQKAIEELPSSGRDFNNLLGLVAGASNLSGGAQNNGWVNHGLNNTFTETSLNGNRPDSISFMVDGVTDTDNMFSSAAAIPPESAIQEFKVQTGLYSAEYGQGAGQVNVAIKSGTNDWHGQGYDYIQNDMFNPSNPLQAEQNYVCRLTSPNSPQCNVPRQEPSETESVRRNVGRSGSPSLALQRRKQIILVLCFRRWPATHIAYSATNTGSDRPRTHGQFLRLAVSTLRSHDDRLHELGLRRYNPHRVYGQPDSILGDQCDGAEAGEVCTRCRTSTAACRATTTLCHCVHHHDQQ